MYIMENLATELIQDSRDSLEIAHRGKLINACFSLNMDVHINDNCVQVISDN